MMKEEGERGTLCQLLAKAQGMWGVGSVQCSADGSFDWRFWKADKNV